MNKYKELKSLKRNKRICLIGHIEPDPDALASMIVFRDFLINHFKCNQVDIFADCDQVSENLLPILGQTSINTNNIQYDTAIMMDSPNSDRLGCYKDIFEFAKQKIVIDHHVTNTKCGDVNIVEICSSTCEIVCTILKEFKFKISKENQGKLYAGIITDTNNFTVGSISERTFKIASEFSKNIDTSVIHNHFLSNNSLKNMQLLGLAIKNIKTYENNQIIISHITQEEAKKLNANFNDFYGIINHLATINSAKLICFIKPKDDYYYVGMRVRRKGGDVSIIAKEFGGGGHVGAAAFSSNENLEKIENLILSKFKEQLKNTLNEHNKLF